MSEHKIDLVELVELEKFLVKLKECNKIFICGVNDNEEKILRYTIGFTIIELIGMLENSKFIMQFQKLQERGALDFFESLKKTALETEEKDNPNATH